MIASLLLLIWTSLFPAVAAEPRRFAVVVGSNDGDRLEERLRFAEHDARGVADVLAQLGGFHEEDVVLLRGADAAGVRRALTDVARRASASPEALVLFYYSGHADASALHLSGTRLPVRELLAAMEQTHAQVRVLVVDACRSGALTRTKGATPAEPFELDLDRNFQGEGVAILASSSGDEDAQESDLLEGGVFTHHLVAGLRGAADISQDGDVTLNEAYRYGYEQTLRSTSAGSFLQHPTYLVRLTGYDDLVLTRMDSEGPVGALVVDRPGTYLFFDVSYERLVSEVVMGEQGSLSLPVGRYGVRSHAGGRVREGVITVRRGERVPVAPHLTPSAVAQSTRRGVSPDKTAWAPVLAAGLSGAPVGQVPAGPSLALGVRVDADAVSVFGRVRYTRHRASNTSLRQDLHSVGADLGLFKLFDVKRLAVGPGVRVGLDGMVQRFQTDGVAPSRQSLAGRVGSALRAEYALGRTVVIGTELELDAFVLPRAATRSGAAVSTSVVPMVQIDVSTFF